ncbi:uncharacterized protein LOC133554753 isoform X3 [Nerophis ophidion]|uniref:uncharacterized protein LOC133554753 isoform X3 n=1 Tax=Nerophis ophidion TaxID=159077 RepID=UPI002ADF8B51|nr:uncharacterized protein LOC133554753 isoform X3 [Nerophis ophidion]
MKVEHRVEIHPPPRDLLTESPILLSDDDEVKDEELCLIDLTKLEDDYREDSPEETNAIPLTQSQSGSVNGHSRQRRLDCAKDSRHRILAPWGNHRKRR